MLGQTLFTYIGNIWPPILDRKINLDFFTKLTRRLGHDGIVVASHTYNNYLSSQLRTRADLFRDTDKNRRLFRVAHKNRFIWYSHSLARTRPNTWRNFRPCEPRSTRRVRTTAIALCRGVKFLPKGRVFARSALCSNSWCRRYGETFTYQYYT